MTALMDFCPSGPDYRLPWVEMDQAYPWIRRLAGCPQDPTFHAEGDVWVHTRMVCEALCSLDAWRSLSDEDRQVLFLAAVLHDVGKPDCTREEGGRITSRGHSRRGAILARQILWEMDLPFARREQVCALIRYHQNPYFLIDRPDAERRAIEISQTARGDLLAILAEADVRGRICLDQPRLLDNVALFAEQMRELNCLDRPFAFATDHARVLFFRDSGRHYLAPAHAAHPCEVVLMVGLPGAGKDHYIRTCLSDWPVVSLDGIREEMEIDPTDEQGPVVAAARERAREHLRQGQRFVWNGTHVSRPLRGLSLNLLHQYQARVHIVYVEAPAGRLFEQNRRRPSPVPEQVLHRLFDRWEVPDPTEAHRVEYQA